MALTAWPWISLNPERLAKRAITAGPSTGLAGLGCSPLAKPGPQSNNDISKQERAEDRLGPSWGWLGWLEKLNTEQTRLTANGAHAAAMLPGCSR